MVKYFNLFPKIRTVFLKHEGVENNDIIRKDLGIWMDFSEESLSKLPHLLYLGLLGLLQNKQTNTHTNEKPGSFVLLSGRMGHKCKSGLGELCPT